jgi:protein gp37
MGNKRYKNGFDVTIHEDLFELPLRWKESRIIFVNSMSDLFHEKIPDGVIRKIFLTMNAASWHTFQVLTKRPFRVLELMDSLDWTTNIWVGTTVESYKYTHRIKALKKIPAKIRFVSFEPLLSAIPMTISLEGIDWAIVGGESGSGARLMDPVWATEIRTLCRKYKTAFFFKQWGGIRKNTAGRMLDGRTWDEMPSTASIA